MFSRGGSLLPSSYADARCIDAVIASQAVRIVKSDPKKYANEGSAATYGQL